MSGTAFGSPSSEAPTATDCLIVGAGLAGLTAARRLAVAGQSVVIVEKAKSVGGRLATRRIGRARLDLGAQFFTVRSDTFEAEVEGWVRDGVAEEWCRGFGTEDGYPRYRATEGMNAVAQHLRQRLMTDGEHPPVLATRSRVNAVIAGPDGWTLTYEAAKREPDDGKAVILTAPVPQSIELMRSGGVGRAALRELDAIKYNKAIAVLTTLDRTPNLPPPGALQQPDDPVFTFVADNQTKGISDVPAVTFHCAHKLSADLWDLDDGSVLARLHQDLRRYLGPALVEDVQVKRWRYAGPVEPHPKPCALVVDQPGPLVVAGDGFGQSKVEGAFLSGLAAAETVLANL